MRHSTILSTLLLLLGLLGASSASANFFSYAVGNSSGESNARYEAQQKAREEGRISCVPQQSSENLWNCQDAYGNKFEDLIITKKEQETKFIRKNANAKRTGN
jgi:hypothetical protein